jgi:hypothetical protein
VYILNKALKTLSKDDKGGLSDWVRCVCQRRAVGYVQAVEVARLPRGFKPLQCLNLRDLV